MIGGHFTYWGKGKCEDYYHVMFDCKVLSLRHPPFGEDSIRTFNEAHMLQSHISHLSVQYNALLPWKLKLKPDRPELSFVLDGLYQTPTSQNQIKCAIRKLEIFNRMV